jgi:hypothetical protein
VLDVKEETLFEASMNKKNREESMFSKVSKLAVAAMVSASVLAMSASAFAYCTNITISKAGAKVNGTTAVNNVAVQRDGASSGAGCTAWPTGTAIWFTLMTENQDAMLASALTALSLGNKVTISCAVEPCTTNGAGILTLITVEK